MQREIERLRLTGWWNNQLCRRRFDLYVLRTNPYQDCDIIGKSLSSPMTSSIQGAENWCQVVGISNKATDWGYLWYFINDLSHAEYTMKCRSIVITSQRWSVERTIQKNWFLFLAVNKRGDFGTLSTPIW